MPWPSCCSTSGFGHRGMPAITIADSISSDSICTSSTCGGSLLLPLHTLMSIQPQQTGQDPVPRNVTGPHPSCTGSTFPCFMSHPGKLAHTPDFIHMGTLMSPRFFLTLLLVYALPTDNFTRMHFKLNMFKIAHLDLRPRSKQNRSFVSNLLLLFPYIH